MSQITVVGSFVMDMTAELEKFPQPGETVIAKSFRKSPGGKGANQAMALARLGADVEMIGKIGDDEAGSTFVSLFEEVGVNTSHWMKDPTAFTAMGIIQLNQAHENKIINIPGANYTFSVEDLDHLQPVLEQTEIVMTQLELPLETELALIHRAHALGKKVVLNPAPAVVLSPQTLQEVDLCTPNETELAILSGKPCTNLKEITEAAQTVHQMGAKSLVVTLGAQGALLVDASGVKRIPGYKVEVVDTVGAGDAFNGGLVALWAQGKPIEDAIAFGHGVAALSVQKKGALPSLPTREEVEAWMESHKPCALEEGEA